MGRPWTGGRWSGSHGHRLACPGPAPQYTARPDGGRPREAPGPTRGHPGKGADPPRRRDTRSIREERIDEDRELVSWNADPGGAGGPRPGRGSMRSHGIAGGCGGPDPGERKGGDPGPGHRRGAGHRRQGRPDRGRGPKPPGPGHGRARYRDDRPGWAGWPFPASSRGTATIIGFGLPQILLAGRGPDAGTRSWTWWPRRPEEAEPGEWITGRGWHQEDWDPAPARTRRRSAHPPRSLGGEPGQPGPSSPTPAGHGSFVNARALELAGIDGTPRTPRGAPSSGTRTGGHRVLREAAQGIARDQDPPRSASLRHEKS
jgi:hypothetical protein